MPVAGARGMDVNRTIARSLAIVMAFAPAAARAGAARPGSGDVPAPSAAAPSSTAPAPPPSRQPIELREIFWGGRYGQVRHGPYPFQGDQPLDGADLYRAMGRDDLVQAYESRGQVKVALAAASLGALLAGAVVVAEASPDTHCDVSPKNGAVLQPSLCRTDWKSGQVATGIGIALLGSALMAVAGLAFTADPLSSSERQRLIETYNASLTPPAATKPAAAGLTAAPALSSNGAGLTVGGRF